LPVCLPLDLFQTSTDQFRTFQLKCFLSFYLITFDVPPCLTSDFHYDVCCLIFSRHIPCFRVFKRSRYVFLFCSTLGPSTLLSESSCCMCSGCSVYMCYFDLWHNHPSHCLVCDFDVIVFIIFELVLHHHISVICVCGVVFSR